MAVKENKVLTKYELRDKVDRDQTKSCSKREMACFPYWDGLEFESPVSFLESLFGFD